MAETIQGGVLIMRYVTGSFGKVLLTVLCCGSMAAGLLPPDSAEAWTYGGYRRGGYYGRSGYGYGNARYMQSQSQAQQDEARRAADRKEGQKEVEKKREEYQTDYLASQAEIRGANVAASRAPRGLYYRAPGFTTAKLPETAEKIDVGGQAYHYYSGIFFRQIPDKLIAVPAPVGAVVDTLPEGAGAAVYKGDADTYFYYFGTFFTKDGGKYKVVDPPAGTVVGYVPSGYTEAEVGDTVQYTFGGITYQPAHFEGNVIFEVVKG